MVIAIAVRIWCNRSIWHRRGIVATAFLTHNLVFRVVLQAADRTLSDKELTKAHTRIVKTVEHQLGAYCAAKG